MYRGYAIHKCNRSVIGNTWYFDIGCSHHMTGNRYFLKDIKMGSKDGVTFADGVQSQVVGYGTLNIPVMPPLNKVLLVKGLSANLLSINQLCDEGLDDKFDRQNCVIYKSGKEYLAGKRAGNDYYLVTPSIICNSVSLSSAELWHQKLGHINYQNL